MRTLFFFLWLTTPILLKAQQDVKPEVRYVGNMGVAIIHRDSVILIDALHDYYGVYYLPSDTSILSKLYAKQRPYRYLLAVSASHIHGDHFDSSLFRKISNALPQARFFLGRQFEPQLQGINKNVVYYADESKTFQVSPGISISIKRIIHVGGERHQNINDYRVEVIWGNYRFIHFGDAEISEKTFSGIEPGADIAIIPAWFCTDDKALRLLEYAKFKKCIVTHIDPAQKPPVVKQNAAKFIMFSKYGDICTLQ